MRNDETQLNSAGEYLPTRSGPRHAAPRKSLLTKLHIPAGKAFALAAMPTAVFVGMGLTPKLALADDATDIPFAPGPCVTRSDEPSESPDPSASASATKTPSPSDTATTGAGGSDAGQGSTATPKPSATPSSGSAPAAAPSASPSPAATENPLDPLGVGDVLKGLLGGPAQETASPSPSATTAAPKSSETKAGAAENPVDTVTGTVKDTADKTADAIRDAAGKAGTKVEELDESVKGLDPLKDEDIPDGAKERFPCPTADPQALAAAELEQGIPLLPSKPWTLESSLLTLKGLDYKGIVEVRTSDGAIKKVLKFTATSLDIKDLHQMTEGPNGTTGHVQAEKGSTSTIRNGTVTMYTEELKGNLFGLIPITFSPQTPPPVNVPFAFFTNVKVTQAGQFGGSLKVPGLHNYFTGGN
ncbi:hypothetical protein [Streptomyces sp. NBC_00316]|uniref:hypothetical protein n=1 Tax=Streptomyces sp. NBC_00316 TaxID=2975710 RepID=UPI002E2AB93A|nr:hypothetical protein [Streptomyces sp. NBC_00316]